MGGRGKGGRGGTETHRERDRQRQTDIQKWGGGDIAKGKGVLPE